MKKEMIIGGAVATAGAVIGLAGLTVKKISENKYIQNSICLEEIRDAIIHVAKLTERTKLHGNSDRIIARVDSMSDSELMKKCIKIAKERGTSSVMISATIEQEIDKQLRKEDQKLAKKQGKENKKNKKED